MRILSNHCPRILGRYTGIDKEGIVVCIDAYPRPDQSRRTLKDSDQVRRGVRTPVRCQAIPGSCAAAKEFDAAIETERVIEALLPEALPEKRPDSKPDPDDVSRNAAREDLSRCSSRRRNRIHAWNTCSVPPGQVVRAMRSWPVHGTWGVALIVMGKHRLGVRRAPARWKRDGEGHPAGALSGIDRSAPRARFRPAGRFR